MPSKADSADFNSLVPKPGSETLSMLEGSLRNLHHAGFREIYEKEVYLWDAAKVGAPKSDARS